MLMAETYVERNSKAIIQRLKSDGWREVSSKGSHHKFKRSGFKHHIVVPHPRDDLPLGTARQIAKAAGWL